MSLHRRSLSPSLGPSFTGALAPLAALALLAALPAGASRPEVFAIEDYDDFVDGDLDGLQLTGDGELILGPAVESVAEGFDQAAVAITRGLDGNVYVGSSVPGRVWRIRPGANKPEVIAEVEQALITAIVPLDASTLAVVTAPSGGVHLISTGGDKKAFIQPEEEVELLLDAAALEGTLYVVGGGKEGVVLRLDPGAKAFSPVATVETKHLRSVAARRTRRGDIIAVGSAEDGLVFALKGERLQALTDAKPDEVVDLLIDSGGRIFAAFVDADGKLTEGASKLAKQAEKESKDKGTKKAKKDTKKKPKPRKVKSAEVQRLDPDGQVTILWQSKDNAAYALGELAGQIVVGTGPRGRLFGLDPEGKRRASLLGRAKEADEVVAFAPTKVGLMMLTPAPTTVQLLTAEPTKKGTFLSGAFDAASTTRLGRLEVMSDGGAVRASVRVGNTKEPDETWSPFSSALIRPGVPAIIGGRYVQLKIEAERTSSAPRVFGARLAHLVHNRAPELISVDVVAPGYKVIANQKSPRESRSVSFGEKAFKKFMSTGGSALEPVTERGGGKQLAEAGWRTIFAYVDDPDDDGLRYRFYLRPVGGAFALVKDWSDEPFVSLDASTYADGRYEVKVEVDDLPGNGPVRALSADGLSPRFVVSHTSPVFEATRSSQTKGGVRLRFAVRASLPLNLVACAVGGGEWVPVDPVDGILDSEVEQFDVRLPGAARFGAASCKASDEGLNEARIDLPVK